LRNVCYRRMKAAYDLAQARAHEKDIKVERVAA
jgi:hypothetical protein